jgi:uncharacterized protein (TIGR02302 family)
MTDRSMADRRLRWRIRLSWAALVWERLWPRLWPAVAIAGAVVALALMDVLPRLPAVLHAGVLAAAALGIVLTGAGARRALRGVDGGAAMRRLDATAPRGERPLTALDDRLLAGRDDTVAEALWQQHRERMAARLPALRVRWPAPDMARREPWGIRALVGLLLVIGIAAAGPDWPSRLSRAFAPPLQWTAPAAAVELWITPPAYTRRPPVFVRASDATPPAPLQLAAGSTLVARVTGSHLTPRLRLGATETAFAPVAGETAAGRVYRAEALVQAGDEIGVAAGPRRLARWPLAVIPDRPPLIAFAAPPEPVGNGLLGLAYRGEDDYGVSAVIAHIRLDPPPAGDAAVGAAVPAMQLPLNPGEPGMPLVSGRELQDLSAHPWAGHSVRIKLVASDATGQTGVSEEVEVVLPERSFQHPVARAIAAERQRLIVDPRQHLSVAGALAAIAAAPAAFEGDIVVALGLAVARARLAGERGADAVPDVRSLLWDLALRIEEGGVPAAERRLQEARQELMQALRNDAPAAEIERLMDALKAALDAYLAALATELLRREQTELPAPSLSDLVQGQDLQDLIDQARELSRSGSTDAARALLRELERMLSGIRLGLQQAPDQEALAAARALMQDLRALEERQRALLERTFQRQRELQGPRGEPPADPRRSQRSPPGEPPADASTQRLLRDELGDMALRMQSVLGEIPAPLGEADQGMRDAIEGLARRRIDQTLSGQSAAADALARALEATGQALSRQLGLGLYGMSPGMGGSDPFGRAGANGRRGVAEGDIVIPDRSEVQRAHELLQELRRRAGERDRPPLELDYIERLLRRF